MTTSRSGLGFDLHPLVDGRPLVLGGITVPSSRGLGGHSDADVLTHAVCEALLGALALGAFIAFALSLPPNRWLRLALWVFVAAELVTNLIPLFIVLTNPAPDNAHTLTFVEDLADSAFFISIGLFASAATLNEPTWLRMVGYVIALASVIRAVGSPLGMTALDQVAPLAFVAFVLLLSVRLLVTQPADPVAQPTR